MAEPPPQDALHQAAATGIAVSCAPIVFRRSGAAGPGSSKNPRRGSASFSADNTDDSVVVENEVAPHARPATGPVEARQSAHGDARIATTKAPRPTARTNPAECPADYSVAGTCFEPPRPHPRTSLDAARARNRTLALTLLLTPSVIPSVTFLLTPASAFVFTASLALAAALVLFVAHTHAIITLGSSHSTTATAV